MEARISRLAAAMARWCVRLAVALLVTVVAIGVSVPAESAARVKRHGSDASGGGVRRRLREGNGERGHVRRRNDIIRKETHVEKRRGWRSVE